MHDQYRSAEDRGKPIFPVRLEPASGRDITAEWQRCDLYGEGPKTAITLDGERLQIFDHLGPPPTRAPA